MLGMKCSRYLERIELEKFSFVSLKKKDSEIFFATVSNIILLKFEHERPYETSMKVDFVMKSRKGLKGERRELVMCHYCTFLLMGIEYYRRPGDVIITGDHPLNHFISHFDHRFF